MDTFTTWVRIINMASSAVLLTVLVAGTMLRWSKINPMERLFGLGFIALYVYVTASSYNGLSSESPLYWFTPVLTIANVWLTGAVLVLTFMRFEHPDKLEGLGGPDSGRR